MFLGSRVGDMYHIWCVEDRPVSALFRALPGIVVRSPALVSVHGIYSGHIQWSVCALVCACAWYGSPA